MKKLKNNAKGITIIALVVTIVVMIILAGVTIRVITGENGILRAAKQAKNDYEDITEEQQSKLDKLSNVMKGGEDITEPSNYETVINIGKTNRESVKAFMVKVKNTNYYEATIIGYNGDGKIADYTSSTYPFKNYPLQKVTINGNVTTIGNNLFYNSTNISGINIPSTVTNIGDNAFSGCSNLSSINISSGVTTIGSNAFSNCSKLTNVSIPNSVTSIGSGAFSSTGLKKITFPAGLTVLPSQLCRNCSQLETIEIPNNVTNIGKQAFYGCTGLTELTIPRNVTSIGESVFENCTGLKILNLQNATPIGSTVFNGCNNITTVGIASGTIADDLFLGTSSLTTVILAEMVTSIGSEAFYGCNGIASITIPSSVTSVGSRAFRQCTGIKTIEFTNNTHYMAPKQTIGQEAFYECTNLESLFLSDNVTEIGEEAFKGCNSSRFTSVDSKKATLDSRAFANCTNLRTVTIGGAYIDSLVFENCTHIFGITLNEGVKNIRGAAFENLGGQPNITIPSTVENIGSDAFSGCGIEVISVLQHKDAISGAPWGAYCKQGTQVVWLDPIEYQLSNNINNTVPVIAKLRYYRGYQTAEISVGNNPYSYFPIAPIKDYNPTSGSGSDTNGSDSPLSACSNLTSVTINEGVPNLGNFLFAGCNFTEITIPSSVKTINQYTFAGCQNLVTIKIPTQHQGAISGYELKWGAPNSNCVIQWSH